MNNLLKFIAVIGMSVSISSLFYTLTLSRTAPLVINELNEPASWKMRSPTKDENCFEIESIVLDAVSDGLISESEGNRIIRNCENTNWHPV